jgi:hypothetical protein
MGLRIGGGHTRSIGAQELQIGGGRTAYPFEFLGGFRFLLQLFPSRQCLDKGNNPS